MLTMLERPQISCAFPDDLSGKRVIVLGAGRSGRAAAALLARHDALPVLADDNPAVPVPDELDAVVSTHMQLVLGNVRPEIVSSADAVVTSPGIPLTHAVLVRARERGLPIIGELELGSRFAKAPMVAVTGTNGKTTTVQWIAHLLGKAGRRGVVCGNVGIALSAVVAETADWFVVEVSSFQLETIERFHPRVAALLNLTADHLDRHPTTEEYMATKARIAANQDAGDRLILNADDEPVWALAPVAVAEVWGFSLAQSLDRGFFCEGGTIVVRTGAGETPEPLLAVDELPLPGAHNRANALAAAAGAWACGVELDAIAGGLRDFPGVEHRLEHVRELRGVTFVNDSKATNPASLQVALRSFDRPIVLIAGGRGKGTVYEPLAPLVAARVRHLVAMGEDAERIEAAWGPRVETSRADDMEQAVREAVARARSGDVVLLSPACASFDLYRNFEERGRHFKELVMRQE